MLPAVRIKLAMVAEPIIAAKAKERMEEGKNQYSPSDICRQGSNKTNYQVAQIAGVSEKNIRKVEKIQKQAEL